MPKMTPSNTAGGILGSFKGCYSTVFFTMLFYDRMRKYAPMLKTTPSKTTIGVLALLKVVTLQYLSPGLS